MWHNTLKTRLARGETALGLWLVAADPISVEVLVGLDFDYSCLDLQHGLVGYHHELATLQAHGGSDTVPLTRVEWNSPDAIGKALDAGFQGIIVPMVNTAAQAREVVDACRYPPLGARSFGPTRAARAYGSSYFERANDEILCLPMIETAEALSNVEDIVATEGVDGVYVGPSDLGISMGIGPGQANTSPEFNAALDRVLAACAAQDKIPAIHSSATAAPGRLDRGFRMVTVTSDLGALLAGATEHLASVRQTIDSGSSDSGSNDGVSEESASNDSASNDSGY
jgi:4-hydroxy-2-oxoheptanedioate aldolase